MTDAHTGEELKFYVNRWLATDEEDGSLCREVPVAREEDPVLPGLLSSPDLISKFIQ